MSESLTALGGLPDPITVPLFRTTPDDALPDSGGHFAPAALRYVRSWLVPWNQCLAHLAHLALGDAGRGVALAPRPRRRRLLPAPLSPALTNYR
jgi:hypothetical protein